MTLFRALSTWILICASQNAFGQVTVNKGITPKESILVDETSFWGREIRNLEMSTTHHPMGRSELSVDITCTADSCGRDCNHIPKPDGSCDGDRDTLIFTYIGTNCDQSDNSQDDFSCDDSNGGPCGVEDALIICVDEVGGELVITTVNVGDTVSFGDKNGLPDEFSCTVKDNEGSTLQLFSVRTANEDDLNEDDVFGSLQLESCKNCLIDITYTYFIQNDGNTFLEITSVERSRQGDSDDVVGLIEDVDLPPGESTSAKESDVLDICVHATIVTVAEATAETPSGDSVSGEGSLEIDVEGLPDGDEGSGKGGKKGKGSGGKKSICDAGKGGKKGKKGSSEKGKKGSGKKGKKSDSGKGSGKKGKKGNSNNDDAEDDEYFAGKKGGSSGKGKGGEGSDDVYGSGEYREKGKKGGADEGKGKGSYRHLRNHVE